LSPVRPAKFAAAAFAISLYLHLLQSIPPHNGNDSSSESFPGQKEKRDQEPRLTTATIRHAEIRRIAPVPGGLKMPTIWLVLYFEFPYFLFHLLRHKVHHRHGAGVPDAR